MAGRYLVAQAIGVDSGNRVASVLLRFLDDHAWLPCVVSGEPHSVVALSEHQASTKADLEVQSTELSVERSAELQALTKADLEAKSTESFLSASASRVCVEEQLTFSLAGVYGTGTAGLLMNGWMCGLRAAAGR